MGLGLGVRLGGLGGREEREEVRKEDRAEGREEDRAEGVFRQVFGTGTMPTGTPVASRRGEGKEIGTVNGIKVGFTTGFGTATLPTGASVASSRSHCELVYRIVALLGFMKFTWHPNLHHRYL